MNELVELSIQLVAEPDGLNLMVQGQAMNIGRGNLASRPRCAGAPRGTVISVLERALARDQTLTNAVKSPANNEHSDISLVNLAKRMDPSRPTPTDVNEKQIESVDPPKPVPTDLLVEDLDSTIMASPRPSNDPE